MKEIDENKMPELGSPEAAVQAAVNLLAAVTKLDERKLAYWLDMYYQLRSRYEAEQAQQRFLRCTVRHRRLVQSLSRQI